MLYLVNGHLYSQLVRRIINPLSLCSELSETEVNLFFCLLAFFLSDLPKRNLFKLSEFASRLERLIFVSRSILNVLAM